MEGRRGEETEENGDGDSCWPWGSPLRHTVDYARQALGEPKRGRDRNVAVVE